MNTPQLSSSFEVPIHLGVHHDNDHTTLWSHSFGVRTCWVRLTINFPQLARAEIANRPSILLDPVSTLASRRERLDALEWSHFDAEIIGTTIGAHISGLDLATGLSDDEYLELRRAMCEYKLLVFRDQQLDRSSHLTLAQRFGELELHPFLSGPDDSPELVKFEKDANVGGYENVWHTDVTWRE